MNLKVTKNIQQLVAQRRAKKIETVRNEVITVNLKDARAKLAESTTTPAPMEPKDVAPVTDTIIEKPVATPQAPARDIASLSPVGEDTPAPTPVAADISSVAGLESVDAPVPPTAVDITDVPVKKPARSRSRSKSKAKK